MSFEVCTSDDKSNFFTAEAKKNFNDGDENRKNENENKNESNNTSVVNDIVFFNSVSGASFPSVDSKIDCCLGQDKKVTFFDDEVEKHDARLDKDRSRQQLSSKITYLTDKVKTVQNQVQAEKVKRKKKEQSLLKLATELKKRSVRKQKDEQRMEELEEKKKCLENQWVHALKALEQENTLHSKLRQENQKDYEQSITEEKTLYEKTVQENTKRLERLKAAHKDQCDELEQEILKANAEADNLQNELAARGLNVSRRGEESSKLSKFNFPWKICIRLLLFLSVMEYFVPGNNMGVVAFIDRHVYRPVVDYYSIEDG